MLFIKNASIPAFFDQKHTKKPWFLWLKNELNFSVHFCSSSLNKWTKFSSSSFSKKVNWVQFKVHQKSELLNWTELFSSVQSLPCKYRLNAKFLNQAFLYSFALLDWEFFKMQYVFRRRQNRNYLQIFQIMQKLKKSPN